MSALEKKSEDYVGKLFYPSWDSLDGYSCPEWFRSAKFGIALRCRTGLRGRHLRHAESLGGTERFAEFDATELEAFDSKSLSELFKESGARFAGLAGWDAVTIAKSRSNRVEDGRDFYHEMKDSLDEQGLHVLVGFEHQWKWAGNLSAMQQKDASDESQSSSLFGFPEKDPMRPDPMPSEEFSRQWLDEVMEVLDHCEPDMLWFSDRLQVLGGRTLREMAAEFYNRTYKSGREGVLTFRNQEMPIGAGTVDMGFSRCWEICAEPWMMNASLLGIEKQVLRMGEDGVVKRLIHDLVDVVSKNGVLLLDVNCESDGRVPDVQVRIMKELGKWLSINGEAIYGARPWKCFGEGPTKAPTSSEWEKHFGGFRAEDKRFTYHDNKLYVTVFGWPEKGSDLEILNLSTSDWNESIESVGLLGMDGTLEFECSNESLRVRVPEKAIGAHAHVFVVNVSE